MSLVEFIDDAPVGLIRLTRPPVNALNQELLSELNRALITAADPKFRAVVIAGEPIFSAGADITEFKAALDAGSSDPLGAALSAVVTALSQLAKPTIAAIAGYALGGGLELAMGTDFRYLASNASLGQPEVTLGLIPGAGGTQRLPRLVGWQRAKELVLSGRLIGAEEALRIGLADRVMGSTDLIATALADAAGWAAGPTAAYAAAKQALQAAWPVAAGLDQELASFGELFATEDAAEGVDAFRSKRSPSFKGR